MRVASWNVNGLRARLADGALARYVEASSPEVLALQETKLPRSRVGEVEAAVAALGWHARFPHRAYACAARNGYAGTALFSARPFRGVPARTLGGLRALLGAGVEPPAPAGVADWDAAMDSEGRVLAVDLAAGASPPLVLLNTYVPNAGAALARLPLRRRWNARVADALRARKAETETKTETKTETETETETKTGAMLLWVGDWNVARTPADLARPDACAGSAGFTLEERADCEATLRDGRLVDVWRHRNPLAKGAYTWWSYRAGERARNIGWRIDYIVADAALLPRILDVRIRADVGGSDHAPLECLVSSG
jgi:exodeoxyribonuclease-3